MNKKLILQILRISIIATIVVAVGFAVYFWKQEMPMKAVMCGTGGALIVFNFFIAIFFINKNIK